MWESNVRTQGKRRKRGRTPPQRWQPSSDRYWQPLADRSHRSGSPRLTLRPWSQFFEFRRNSTTLNAVTDWIDNSVPTWVRLAKGRVNLRFKGNVADNMPPVRAQTVLFWGQVAGYVPRAAQHRSARRRCPGDRLSRRISLTHEARSWGSWRGAPVSHFCPLSQPLPHHVAA